MNTRIKTRGKPALTGPVHFREQRNITNVRCFYGSYHIRFTYDKTLVTCKKCLADMSPVNPTTTKEK